MADDTFSGSDFESAASATASPDSAAVETAQPTGETTAPTASTALPETAATGQAAAATPVPETPKGPIPFDVHHTALQNARVKAIEEWRQQHGWAEQVDRAAVQEAERLGQLYQRDRAGYIRTLLDEALTDAELAPVLRSEFGRRLGQRTQAEPSFEPDIPVYDDRGQLVAQTFSAQKVQDLVKHAVAEALGQEVGPIKERIKKADAAAQHAREIQQINTSIDTAADYLGTLPHFAEHEAEIAAVIAQLPKAEQMSAREAGLLAYAHVMQTKVLPGLSTSERKKVLADINQKPSASTVSPSSGTTAVPKADADKSWEELLEERAPQFLGSR